MALDLSPRLEALARRIDRRRWASAACWTFAAVASAALALMAIDWALAVESPAGRASLTATVLIVAATGGRRVWRAVRGRTTPLALALAVERRRPELGSLLSSAVQFDEAAPDDPAAGSLQLRRAVVMQASTVAAHVDFSPLLARAPLRAAVLAALAAAAAIVMATVAAPREVAIGAQRLVNPLSGASWPRRHELEFVAAPRMLPVGGDFEATLRARRGLMPQSVEVQYRTRRGNEWTTESQVYTGAPGSVTAVRSNVRESFEYRAVGGDHRSMPWSRVRVAPAPELASLQLTVEAPAYAEREPQAAEPPLSILAGSTIHLRATTTDAVATAELHAAGQPPIVLSIDPKDRTLHTPPSSWQPRQSGEWRLQVTTPAGMTSTAGPPIEVEVRDDEPPSVEIIEPRGGLVVTAQALVPLELSAQDDVGLRSLHIEVMPAESAEDGAAKAVPLYRRSASASPGRASPDRQGARYVLDVSTLDAQSGDAWEIRGQAEDLAGQEAASIPLRLQVVAEEELLRRLSSDLSKLSERLSFAASKQRVAGAAVELPRSGDAPPAAVARAAADAALPEQRTVRDVIAEGPQSALALSREIADEYLRNRLDNHPAAARLRLLRDRLQALAVGPLQSVEDDLLRVARSSAADGIIERLQRAREAQDQILAVLESSIEELSELGGAQQFVEEWLEILSAQTELTAESRTLGRLALTATNADPAPSRARRETAAALQQRELAARVGGVLGRMRQWAETPSGAGDATAVQAALAVAQTQQLQVEVRAAGDHLAGRRFSQALDAQHRVTETLAELLAQMQGRGADFTRRQIAALLDAQQELQGLRARVQQLASPPQPAPGAAETARRALASETEQLAKQLSTLNASAPAKDVTAASEKLQAADASARSDQTAADDLARAEEALQAEIQRREIILERLELQRLDAALGQLIAGQRVVVGEIDRIAGLQNAAVGRASGDAASVVQALAAQQAAVRESTLGQAEAISEYRLFADRLHIAGSEMQHAQRSLVDQAANAAEPARQALEELQLVAQAVQHFLRQPSAPRGDQKTPGASADSAPKADDEQVQALQIAVAQLGLLRSLEQRTLDETVELERRRAHDEAADLGGATEIVAIEQQSLAEAAEYLAQTHGAGQGAGDESPLPRAAQKMRRAGQSLAASDLSGVASAAQRQAIQALDSAISAMQKQCEARGGQCSKPPTSKPPSSTPGKQPGAQPGAAGQQQGGEQLSPPDRAALDQLVRDVWGELPARQREQLLQPLGERFLPEYAAEVEAYFRDLAEPDRSAENQP